MRCRSVLLPVAAQCSWAYMVDSSSSELVARQNEDPSLDNFIRRVDVAAAILGDYLYLLGGHVARKGGNDPKVEGANATLSLPLNKDWQPADVEMVSFAADAGPPATFGHGVWSDGGDEQLFSWGGSDVEGETSGAKERSLWKMTPNGDGGGTWEKEDVPDEFKRTTRGGFESCGGKGYTMGGRGTVKTDDAAFGEDAVAVPGLVSYDFESGEWNNHSTEAVTDDGTWLRGATVCVDMPDRAPKLFLLGGSRGLKETDTLDFVYVHYWDPEREEWLRQETAGVRPAPRVDTCAVGVNGPNGTYDIFLYSGWRGSFEDGGVLDDVWTLSIPAFRWFRAPLQNAQGRHAHECVRIGSQMVVIGGGARRNWWDSGDTLDRGLGVMDLNSVTWKNTGFEANSGEYRGPKAVRDYYEEHGYDTTVWENDKVKAAFSQTAPSPTPSDPDPEDEPSDAPDTPVIVGGVVGGVGGAALVALLAWWLTRRRLRKSRDRRGANSTAAAATTTDAQQYGPVPPAEVHNTSAVKYEVPGTIPGEEAREMDATGVRRVAELP